MDEEITEVIQETIASLEAVCRITLYDIYGSTDGFNTTSFQQEAEENAEYEKSVGPSNNPRRGD